MAPGQQHDLSAACRPAVGDAGCPRKVRRDGLLWGGAIGTLGGLIGLGGAEFRLPVLLAWFRLAPLAAVLVNLQVSLVTVAAALSFRGALYGSAQLWGALSLALPLLGGSLFGAWLGASLGARIDAARLRRLIAMLLVGLAVVMLAHDRIMAFGRFELSLLAMLAAGLVAGLGIGVVSSLLGVAGGELIIPVLVFLYGLDIKLAGTVSLAISLPTLLVGLARYRRNRSFARIASERGIPPGLVGAMALGSVAGALLGAVLLAGASMPMLHGLLGLILLASAFKLLWLARRRR